MGGKKNFWRISDDHLDYLFFVCDASILLMRENAANFQIRLPAISLKSVTREK